MSRRPAPEPCIDVAILALWRREDRVRRFLLTRRRPDVHLGGWWEMPGGKVERGEEPVEAARRETFEEVGIEVGECRPLVVVEHRYPDRCVRLHAFECEVPDLASLGGPTGGSGGREPAPGSAESPDRRWVALEALAGAGLPAANAGVVAALSRRFADAGNTPAPRGRPARDDCVESVE